jgi:hypothetical protein
MLTPQDRARENAAYHRGYADAARGVYKCPYDAGTLESDAWDIGQDAHHVVTLAAREENPANPGVGDPAKS